MLASTQLLQRFLYGDQCASYEYGKLPVEYVCVEQLAEALIENRSSEFVLKPPILCDCMHKLLCCFYRE